MNWLRSGDLDGNDRRILPSVVGLHLVHAGVVNVAGNEGGFRAENSVTVLAAIFGLRYSRPPQLFST